jgi:hypothetical protein
MVAIREPSMTGNAGPGIDLAPKRVTPNHLRKTANEDLDWPEPVVFDPDARRLEGRTEPFAVVEVFDVEGGARAGNPRNGEGERFLGAVVADAEGRFVFPASGGLDCPQARLVTLTATRPSDPPVTSEFSPDLTCEPPTDPLPPTPTSAATPGPTDTPTPGPTSTPTPPADTPMPEPTCHLVQTEDRTLCRGTCPVTGEECRAFGFRTSCGRQPVDSFSPCTCLTDIGRCSSSTGGCKHPDEVCTIPGGDPRFDTCEEAGDCQCVPVPEL